MPILLVNFFDEILVRNCLATLCTTVSNARAILMTMAEGALHLHYRCGRIIVVLYPWYYTILLYNTLDCVVLYSVV